MQRRIIANYLLPLSAAVLLAAMLACGTEGAPAAETASVEVEPAVAGQPAGETARVGAIEISNNENAGGVVPSADPAAARSGEAMPVGMNNAMPEQVADAEVDVGSFGTVQVSGVGKATAEPDQAMLTLGVSVTDDTVAAARNAAATAQQAVVDAVLANDIDERDIKTAYFHIYAEYDYSNGRETFQGYTVSNSVTVRMKDVAAVGAVIDAAVEAGGNDIAFDGVAFGFSEALTAKLEREARKNAVADMQEKAAQLAEFAGVELGELFLLSDGAAASPYPPAFRGMVAEAATIGAFDTPVFAGEDTVTVSVHGEYGLK